MLILFFLESSEVASDPQIHVCNWKTHTWGWGAESNEVLLHMGLVNGILLQVLRWLWRAVCQGCWRVTDPQFPMICCRDINFLHTVSPSVWLLQLPTSFFYNVYSNQFHTHMCTHTYTHTGVSPPHIQQFAFFLCCWATCQLIVTAF